MMVTYFESSSQAVCDAWSAIPHASDPVYKIIGLSVAISFRGL